MTSLHALPHYVESKASYDLLVGRKVRRISDADLHELLLDVTSVPESTIVDELLERWSVFAGEQITEADIEVMLRTGHLPANVLQAISQTNAETVAEIRVQAHLVVRDFASQMLAGVDGVDLEKVQALATGESEIHSAIMAVLEQRQTDLAVELTEGQSAALSMLVEYYTSVAPSTTGALAQRIGDFVGLTERETQIILNYRTGLANEGVQGSALDSRVSAYADLMEHRRALRIARTEMSAAATEGNYEALAEARDQGLVVGTVYKRFDTADDEMVCDLCSSMDGVTVGENEDFGEEGDPPLHPNCRCGFSFLEEVANE